MFAKGHCAHDEDICSGLRLASFQPWGVKGAFPISRPSWPLLHPHRPALGQQTGKTGHNRCPLVARYGILLQSPLPTLGHSLQFRTLASVLDESLWRMRRRSRTAEGELSASRFRGMCLP